MAELHAFQPSPYDVTACGAPGPRHACGEVRRHPVHAKPLDTMAREAYQEQYRPQGAGEQQERRP